MENYYLGGEVLEHGGEVDRSAGAVPDRVTAFLQVTSGAADGELETGFAAPRRRLLGDSRSDSFSTAGHSQRDEVMKILNAKRGKRTKLYSGR